MQQHMHTIQIQKNCKGLACGPLKKQEIVQRFAEVSCIFTIFTHLFVNLGCGTSNGLLLKMQTAIFGGFSEHL